MSLREKIEKISELVYVPKCTACGELLELGDNGTLCIKCRSEWEKEKLRFCNKCKEPHVWCRCGAIFNEPQGIIKEYIHLVAYSNAKNTVAKRLILRAKRKNYRRIFNFLADELIRTVRARLSREYIENAVTVAAPRRSASVRKYGFDQTAYLAKAVAERLGIEDVKAIKRRGGKMQKGLDRYSRFGNAERSYKINYRNADRVYGKNVLLIDDIVTTGATVLACGDLLAEAGAASAAVLSVAHSEYSKRGSLSQKEMQ